WYSHMQARPCPGGRYFGVSESSLLSPGFGGAGVAGGVDAGADWGSGAGCDGVDCDEAGGAGGGDAGGDCTGVGAAGIVITCVFLSGRYRAPFWPQPAASSVAPSTSSRLASFIRASP